ncbi:uncharacterized protein K02A2.6-like [Ornithodoros turicata]|uniref:uncharacterized protein K02A2.6-like n=1 Tax=Ornithodoros turicata TaxID=34597 RepID=UPI0031395B2F
MCRTSQAQAKHKKGKRVRKVKLVTDVFIADEEDGKFLTCKIQDKQVVLQVDTGSRTTLLDDRTYKTLGEPRLHPSPVRLRAFNKNEIPLRGAADLHVFIDGREETLPLGRCTKTLVHLHLENDAQPKFFKPRPNPFAAREAVQADLQRQVKNGVLEPVEVSEWATPIVVVPKPNGAVRVCGDFSVTVNPQIEIAQYPLPRTEELLAVLSGGQKFTKLDLSEAYLQMELDDEAKRILVVKTHKGLYRFNRLPFGIASAPAVFPRTMEQVMPSVACYLDDIIVTGKNGTEHLKNLEQVLEPLRQFGFTLKKEKCAFMQHQVEYLGHGVTAEGFRPSA